MNHPLGVQIAPWTSARDVYEAGPLLATAFDVVWVPDQMLARNAQVLLTALASTGRIGVASGVAVALGRNPVDMAVAMATISELLPPDRPMLMGMGAGGSLVSGLFVKTGATDLLRESIDLIRRLWAGETVRLETYPTVGAQLPWKPHATVRLTFAVERQIPILAAVGGPRTMRLVEDVADGLLCTSTYPPLSYAALCSDGADAGGAITAMVARRERAGRPLRLVYGLNCCVSSDRDAARAFARRQVALIVGNPALLPLLAHAGLDLDSVAQVRGAFERGGGVEEAGRRLSDSLLDGFVVAGTAEECAGRLAEVVIAARRAGFAEFYLGAPLGPDLPEAARLLVDAVVPQVWPS
jgi:alkanesulfonate monooxygenase SsuD/methylene tetrahydromethanopterin reductase-like flavin-dependent oxidoreductase (luciferase family)